MPSNALLKKIILGFVLTFLISAACENEDEPTLATFQFPTEIGNSWKYAYQMSSNNWEPAGAGAGYGINMFDTGTTEIVSLDTLNDGTIYYRFETEWISRDNPNPSIRHLGNNDNGMYLYGYSNIYRTGPPKVNANENGYLIFKGQKYRNYNELYSIIIQSVKGISVARVTGNGLTIEERPIKELTYPLLVGKQWVYRDVNLNDAWDMDKKILKIENVTVPAGKFICFRIEWFWDIDDDGVWDTDITGYDYLAPIGYLKRQFDWTGIIQTDELGDTIGTFDSRDTYELIDYQINN